MAHRFLSILAGCIAILVLPEMAQAGNLPDCTEADMADLPRPGFAYAGADNDKVSAWFKGEPVLQALFDAPIIQYPFGSLDIYGFDLAFVVGVDGKVTCASIKPAHRATGPVLNAQRQRFIEDVSGWRFKPFLVDGKAVRAFETLQITEQELPQTHKDMPTGDPELVTITQDMRPEWASFGPYHVELHGDGSAIYTSGDRDDPLGPQSYRVDPKAIQALLDVAKAADFWSLRDQYRRSPNAYDGTGMQRINITIGGKTKSLTDYLVRDAGMPEAVEHLQNKTMAAANIDLWQSPSLATLEQLKTNDYDFKSKPAGRLLLQMAQNRSVKNEAILALIELGAPQDAMGDNRYNDQYESLIEAALGTGRTTVAVKLIGNGALLTDGKIDPKKVNWAFSQAVYSGNLAAVDLILPFHPDMTYPDYEDPPGQVSIIRRLGDNRMYGGNTIAVAQRLIDLGADVNAHGPEDGTTLLHKAVYDADMMRFLLAHGADINALDKEDMTPLASTTDETMALFLLSKGADPRIGKTAQRLRFNIKHNHWTEVKVWLLAHGYADLLVPQQGDH